jgi:hypothetical protein
MLLQGIHPMLLQQLFGSHCFALASHQQLEVDIA